MLCYQVRIFFFALLGPLPVTPFASPAHCVQRNIAVQVFTCVCHRMPGSTFKKCKSCNVHISVACKTCKHCGQKQEMKKAIQVAKQKINEKWVKNMKVANNFCKLVNSANVLMHKMQALGRYPVLLLGKRNMSGSFTTDVITDSSFSSPEEKLSIETIKNIFSSLLKVKYSAQDSEVESSQSMFSSEEDCVVSAGVDTTAFHKEDNPRASIDEENVVTLILTPVDLSEEPSLTFQPPIKKRILEKTKVSALASPPKSTRLTNPPFPYLENVIAPPPKMPAQGTSACDPVTYITHFTAEDSSADVHTSSAAANVPHLPVTKSLKGPKNNSADVHTFSAAANVPHLPVTKSLKGPKDNSADVHTFSAAANVPHLPVTKSLKGPKDNSADVHTFSAAANVPHLPVTKSLKGPKNNSADVHTFSAAANVPHLPVTKSLKGPKDNSADVHTFSAAANVPHLPVSQTNKFRYKIKDCPVHLLKEHFPFVKTLGTRIAKNGNKETKVRWQPCSGCGVKWKDTWEPYELFHSDE
nr:uncharacterized protein LOC129431316 isoform X2 [Misgurnus anguillicaudatus]